MLSNLKDVLSSTMAGVTGTTKVPPREECLAEFRDDQLTLNEETLSLLTRGLKGRKSDNSVPVTIVSVIGPPNSKKTFTMNSICRLLIPEAFRGKTKDAKVFPERADCERGEYFQSLRGQDAVLVAIPPIIPPQQNSITDDDRIILLDIWSWEPSPEKYSKMVDFCLKASSVVVYVGLPQEEEAGIWIRSQSSLEKPHLYFTEFFLLVQTSPAMNDSDSETVKISEFCEIISKDFEKTTPVKFQNLADDFKEAWQGKPKNYFIHIQNAILSTKCRNFVELQHYFISCIDLKTDCVDPSTLLTERIGISSSDVETPEEFCVRDSVTISTVMQGRNDPITDKTETLEAKDDPIVVENAKSHDEQLAQLLPLPSKVLELYWNKMTYFYAASKSLFLSPQEIKANHDNIMSKNVKVDTSVYADEEITVLYDHFRAFHSMMEHLCCQVHKECGWKTKATLDSIYTNDIRDILRFFPENDPNSFNTLSFVLQSFNEKLQIYEDSFQNKKIQNSNLHLFSKQLTAIADERLDGLQQESALANNAASEASALFGHVAKKLLVSHHWPDHELRQILRQTASLFDEQFSSSFKTELDKKLAWEISRVNLSIMMKTHARDVISGNQIRIKDLDRVFEKVCHSCYECYQITVNQQLPQYKIPTETFTEMSNSSREASKMKLFGESGKDVNSKILEYWWKCLDVQLEKAEQKFLKKNEGKPEYSPDVHSEISRTTPSSSVSGEPHPHKEMLSLGIHVGQDRVRIGVYDSGFESFQKTIISHHPFIAFRNGKIVLGKEAKTEDTEDPTFFDIFNLISRPDRSHKQEVILHGKHFFLTENEAVALFFIELLKKVKKRFQEKFRTCVILASNLLPSAGRQTLREIMSIAGFNRVIFVPTTAAMALNLLHNNNTQQKRPLKVMCIHYAGHTLEIAKVKITSEQILVKETEGYLNFEKAVDETYQGFTKLAIKKVVDRISGKRKSFDAVLVNKGKLSHMSITEYLGNPKEFPYETTTLPLDSVLFYAAMLDANGGHTYSDRKISYHIPYSLSVNGIVHDFPRGPNDIAKFQELSGKREAVKVLVVSEGICHPDGRFDRKWDYRFEIVPPAPSCSEIELAKMSNGCFKLLSKDERYTISSTDCKFLTIMDMRSLEVTLENIQKHESSNGEDAMNEMRNELRQLVEKVEVLLKEKANESGNHSVEVVRIIDDHVNFCKSVLDMKNANSFRIRVALKQLEDISKDFL